MPSGTPPYALGTPGGRSRRPATGRRVRTLLALWALAELAVFIALAAWIGVGWTVLAALGTSALGGLLLARQGTRTLTELRERAQTRRPPGRALGDAALVALGGLLMVLPGFLGDLAGLLCLLPGTRALPRALVARGVLSRLPVALRGPVRIRSTRAAPAPGGPGVGGPGVGGPGVGGPGVGESGVGESGVGAPGAGKPGPGPDGGWRPVPVIEGEVVDDVVEPADGRGGERRRR